ncbi:MAG: methyltransferase domain-containing protein [Anaerolineae bacterium]|nr:methyltransferase domain-containing protein [Anaerolineae bacterium]
MSSWLWVPLGLIGLLLLGLLAYWQFVITEGTYLGQWMVTWLYDLTANRYDGIKQFDDDMEAIYLGRPLATALKSTPVPLICDIGTGTARLPLALLAQPTFQGKIVGLDDSRQMLRTAVSKTGGYENRLTLIWRDTTHLPFPDAVFDAVTCLEMLEFTPSPRRQLAEAIRVLRPGGILLTTRRRGFDARMIPGKTFTVAQCMTLLEELGIVDVQVLVWQVDYDLVWGRRDGNAQAGARPILEILLCPRCNIPTLVEKRQEIYCEKCSTLYPIRDGIIELR